MAMDNGLISPSHFMTIQFKVVAAGRARKILILGVIPIQLVDLYYVKYWDII
jgi:hypothetical protein